MGDNLTAKLDMSYEDAIPAIAAALKTQGFGVLTEIDVKSTLKAKIGADFRKYAILGACNPNLAHQALSHDLNIGLLLPCNVIVYEEDGGSVVSIVNPLEMLDVARNPEMAELAEEAKGRLIKVIDVLVG